MEKNARNYFFARQEADVKNKGLAIAFLAGGVVAMLIAFAVFSYNSFNSFIAIRLGLVGVLGIIAGIGMLNRKKTIYLSGDEYDSLVNQMIEKLGSNAREFLGLDSSEVDEIEPISFEGYKFVGSGQIRKDPKDKIWRSDLYERVTVFFTKNEIHLYKVFLNTLSGKITETTDVLFYDDVVSVSTKNEVEKIGNNTIEYISFNLVSKGGNNVSIALNGDDNRQRSINAMRAMIKEKKTQ